MHADKDMTGPVIPFGHQYADKLRDRMKTQKNKQTK